MLGPGDVLGDRYRLDAYLAKGGMGEVWQATDVVLGRTVAVKVLLAALLTDPGFAMRFRAEARILATFRHPNVVDVYDFGEQGDTAYLVMAYVAGEALAHRLATDTTISVADTMSLVTQAASALHAAHSGGVIHRDVKPGNLIVQPDGTVVLVDFGVARAADMTAITAANAVPGTVLYMAPEQVSGKPVTPATDIYALGAVAYQCLAGTPPFPGDAPMQVALKHLNDPPPPLPDHLPEPVRALIDRTLAKDPADRYPTAAALATDAARVGASVGAMTGAAGVASRLLAPTRADFTPVPPVATAKGFAPAVPDAVDPPSHGHAAPTALAGSAFAGNGVTGSNGTGGRVDFRSGRHVVGGPDASTVAAAAGGPDGNRFDGNRPTGLGRAPVAVGAVGEPAVAGPPAPRRGSGGRRSPHLALIGAAALLMVVLALAVTFAFTHAGDDKHGTTTPDNKNPAASVPASAPTTRGGNGRSPAPQQTRPGNTPNPATTAAGGDNGGGNNGGDNGGGNQGPGGGNDDDPPTSGGQPTGGGTGSAPPATNGTATAPVVGISIGSAP